MHQTHIVKIDPKGKYILIFRNALTNAQAQNVANMLAEWLKSDKPFLILDSDTRLERMDVLVNNNGHRDD